MEFLLLNNLGFLEMQEIIEEEELEWISNKDTFPMVESLVDFIPSISTTNNTLNSINNHQSPNSVLENTINGNSMMINLPYNFKVPGKARTKHGRRRRTDMLGGKFQWWNSFHEKSKRRGSRTRGSSMIGRKCLHCGSEKTPQWRAGPFGPKTLCNACGVRYKSGRLCDEYRPANSPTFSIELHSNSHRKVVELRRLKNEKIMKGIDEGYEIKEGGI